MLLICFCRIKQLRIVWSTFLARAWLGQGGECGAGMGGGEGGDMRIQFKTDFKTVIPLHAHVEIVVKFVIGCYKIISLFSRFPEGFKLGNPVKR